MLVVDPPMHDPPHLETEWYVGVGPVTDGHQMPARVHLSLEPSEESHHHISLIGGPLAGLLPELEQALEGDQGHFLAW